MRRGGHTTRATSSLLSLPGASDSSTSLSSLAQLPEKLHRSRVIITSACRRAAEFLDLVRTDLLPQYAKVLPLVAPESL
jgi:hypothetical protein